MDKKGKKSFVSAHKQTKEPITPTVSASPTVPVQTDEIKLTSEQAASITAADQAKLQARLNLADIEMYLTELQNNKAELLSQVRSSSDAFMKVVREVAVANGIDPDGKQDDSKWNLNTNTMTFNRVK